MTFATAANPLLEKQFQIPFDQIRAGHVEPAVDKLLGEARERLDQVTSDAAPRTFANTMERLDRLTERLEYAMHITRNLEATATTPELRAPTTPSSPRSASSIRRCL